MSINVNTPRPTPATTTTTTAGKTPSASELKEQGVQGAKDLLTGGSYKIGVDGKSTPEQIAGSLTKVAGDKGVQFTNMLETLGQTYKGVALNNFQKNMDTWLKANQNAGPEKVFEKASQLLTNATLMSMTMKQTIDKMTSDAISKMGKDSFEG